MQSKMTHILSIIITVAFIPIGVNYALSTSSCYATALAGSKLHQPGGYFIVSNPANDPHVRSVILSAINITNTPKPKARWTVDYSNGLEAFSQVSCHSLCYLV